MQFLTKVGGKALNDSPLPFFPLNPTQGRRPWGGTSLGGWYNEKYIYFKMCCCCFVLFFLCTPPPALPSNGSSKLKSFVEQCYRHKTKKHRVQWPRLTPWTWCPRRLPAGYCWGSVQSAALCWAGGKQMDKSNTHISIYCTLLQYYVTPKCKIWLMVFRSLSSSIG